MSQENVEPNDGKIRYVQRTWKNGVLHLYFRKGDYREGPLLSPDGSDELREEVKAILNRLKRNQAAAAKPKAGTVGGLIAAYRRSAEFLSNARSTQKEYERMLDDIDGDCGDVLLGDVTRSWIIDMRDAWALRGYRVANLYLQMLKNTFAPVLDDETDNRITGNPFNKVANVKRPSDLGEAHPIWTIEEVWAAIDDAIARGTPGLARAIALGRFGGFRRGTICRIPRHARSIEHDAGGNETVRLYWITEKRKVLCDKREDPRLTDVLARTPNRALTIAYNADGNVFKERQFNQALERHLNRLAKSGRVRSAVTHDGEIYCPLDIHGLRHSRGTELAEAGASEAEIMAQLEQLSPAAAAEYRRQANRKRMADAAQDRVDNITELKPRTARERKL